MTGRGATRDGDAGGGVDWGKVADGIGLAGFGVFFLLATTHGLPPGFWLDALGLWPVLLISAGIRVVFERSPLPWGVLLGPLVVLGTLSWLAWGERPPTAPPGEWREVSAVRSPDVRKLALDIQGAGAHLDLAARSLPAGVLARGRAASRGDRARLRAATDDTTTTLRFEGHGGGVTILPGRKAVWEVAVADDVPLEVRVGAIMSRSNLHLERARLTKIEAQGAFQVVVMRLPPPRARVAVELNGPFCSYDLIVPDGTAVHLGHAFPVSLVSRGPATGKPLGEDEAGYDVSFGGPFGSLTIREAPLPAGVGAPPREPPSTLPAEEPPATTSPAEAPAGPGPPPAPPAP